MAYGVLVAEATLAIQSWLDAQSHSPGTRLPSERNLARQLGLNHYAVNRAIGRLIAEGRLERNGYRLSSTSPQRPSTDFTCDVLLAKRSSHIKSYRRLAKEMGLHLNYHFYHSVEETVSILRQLNTPETRSVIFEGPHAFPISIWENAMVQLLNRGIAAITVRQFSPLLPSILDDNARALEMAFFHLRELGHQEIALLTSQPRTPVTIEIHQAWQSLCRHQHGRTSLNRIFFQNSSNPLLEDAREVSQRLRKDWKDVTAAIIFAEEERIVPNLLTELARQHRHVPRDLSLICVGDQKSLGTLMPPISALAFDSAVLQEAAISMAQRMVRKKQNMGILPPSSCFRLEPQLILRGSTRPHPAFVGSAKSPRQLLQATTGKSRRDDSSVTKSQDPRSILRQPYGLTERAKDSNFTSIDLSSHVNRPLNFRRGWLGDLPLKSLPPGKHIIHGIPFDVLGGTSRTNKGVVVFRSAINTTGGAHILPSELRIPIDCMVDSIYILHGCGYARYLQPFATYRFYSGTRRVSSVPLITLGQPPPELDAKTLLKANIQDWWSDYPHPDFPHARPAPLRENEDENAPPRYTYLYTLEWINPRPKTKITHLTVTVDPSQSITLGLLAVSAFKK